MSGSCPPIESLQGYVAGVPSADDQAIADHVESCGHCQASLQQIAESAAPLPTIESTDEPIAPKNSFLRLMQQFGPQLERDTQPNQRPLPNTGNLPSVPGYLMIEEIGRGGMGVVYRARHEVLGRTVAIKMLPQSLFLTPEDRKQLREEAEAIARLRHPNIVQLYEFGEVENRPYLVLEDAEGGTLRDWVAGRALASREAARIVEVLAEAVQHAHSRETLHGDLKPGNVLLATLEGTTTDHIRVDNLKVSDFGLARRLDLAHAPTNDLTGTPAYMAPEQVPDAETQGGPSAHATTDVYALGAVLYELLTGHPPFTGPDWQTILLHVRHRLPLSPRQLVPEIPLDLEAVCLKCLEKSPSARYPSASALASDLRRFRDGMPTVARPLGLFGRAANGARRKPFVAAAIAAVVVAIMCSVVALASLLVSSQRQWAMERQLRDQAEARLYASRISQADLLWRECNLGQAIAVLNACPVDRRGWEWYYLRALCDDGFLALSAPQDHEIYALATDGSRIAAVSGTPSGRGRLRLWEPGHRDGHGEWDVPHVANGARVAFIPNGRLVTLGPTLGEGTDPKHSTLAVWEIDQRPENLPLAHLIREHTVGAVHSLSDNGQWLATGELGGVSVLDLSTDAPPTVLSKPPSSLREIAINSRGTVVVGAAGASDVFVWHPPHRDLRAQWAAPSIQSLAIRHDGSEVAGREAGGRFRRRNTLTGKPLHDEALYTRLAGPTEYSPNGRFVLVQRADGVRVFDTSINQRSVLSGPRGEGSSEVTSLGIKALQNGAATGESNGAVRLWELALGQPDGQDASVYRGHIGAIRCVAFDPTEKWMLTGGADGRLRAWDLSRPQRFLPLRTNVSPNAMSWSKPEREVLTVAGNRVTRYETVRGTRLDEVKLPIATPTVVTLKGLRVAVAAPETTVVQLWDIARVPPTRLGEIVCDHSIEQLDLAANRKVLLAAGQSTTTNEFTMSAWSAETRQRLWTTSESARPTSFRISEDARLVATAPQRGSPRIHRMSDGSTSVELANTQEVSFHSVVFSLDDRKLAAVGNSTVHVWSLHTGQVEWSDTLPEPAIGVAFSSDSTRVAVVLAAGDVHLRDASGGQELLRLAGPTNTPRPNDTSRHMVPCFSPNGQQLVTPSRIGPLVWEASLDLAVTREAHADAVLDRPKQ